MKSVLIVGAGPAGLVAAKTLLHHHPSAPFKVTVLEQRGRIGGMWGVEPPPAPGGSTSSTQQQQRKQQEEEQEQEQGLERKTGSWSDGEWESGAQKCSSDMRTNLSRFTVGFSDFAWDSVEMVDGRRVRREELPMFPRAWQVGRYLRSYARAYIPEGVINLRCRVTRAERVKAAHGWGWKVEWTGPPPGEQGVRERKRRGSKGDEKLKSKGGRDAGAGNSEVSKMLKSGATFYQGFFDHLVVASGFFNEAKDPDFVMPRANSKSPTFPGRIVHSSQFRHIRDLVPKSSPKGSIVVVGGGMSGSEAAATIAAQLSDAKYSPKSSARYDGISLYHVMTRPFYPLPRHLPSQPKNMDGEGWNMAPNFTPLDLCLYNLGRRPNGPILPMNGRMAAEKAEKSHIYLRSLVGGDQSELGRQELVHTQIETKLPAYVGITDTYAAFVGSGDIIPIKGRATALEPVKGTNAPAAKADSGVSWALKYNGQGWRRPTQSEGHDGSDTSMLDEESSDEIPARDKTVPDVIAVVYANGFSPHMGINWLAEDVRSIMECSSSSQRLPLLFHRHCICHDDIPNLAFVGFYEGPFWGVMEMQARCIARKWSMETPVHKQSADEILEMRELRDAMLQHSPDIPQFWMGDYVGLMEGFASELGIPRDDTRWNGQRLGPCIAARYAVPSMTPNHAAETKRILDDLQDVLVEAETKGRFVAAAAFRGMQGTWNLRRNIKSRLPEFPSGRLEGTASLHPRLPTEDGYDAEYLYIEKGTFSMDNGFSALATRRYVYRYNAAADKITAWFVKEDGRTVDYFFNQMVFEASEKKETEMGWVARGDHLCVKDMYKSRCEFRFRGATLDSFSITYDVKGPKKDYTSESWYQR